MRPFPLPDRMLIIAEIGNNHEGDFGRAQALVEAAARAGADAVKFQSFRTDRFISRRNPQRFEQLKRFELSADQFRSLARQARQLGIGCFTTPLDLETAAALGAEMDALKIASGDNRFLPLIEQAIRSGKPLILSCGASTETEIRRTVDFIGDRAELALLHCVSAYPVQPADAHLRVIPRLRQLFPELPIGYSDHTEGNTAPLLAVALGARIIEKHFTLDKNLSDFRDHRLSADPEQMRALVEGIRTASAMLGRPEKEIQPCEAPVREAARRGTAAGRDLPEGAALAAEDLVWLRHLPGVESEALPHLLGKRLKRPVSLGEPITREDLL
ncbi:MAG: hypothetical protein COV76_04085 [Candidatus Omnitrophica bacterium CG11_big_fil_rev_8_21_14_0_20_64_10]|nr:MAG: hypothetical protein COV76_04085 [Candidatus Omnitrophica bacterium CG11_big_fil_rev_8_21_14_0_20_64_10]